jgi:hypothetical protein
MTTGAAPFDEATSQWLVDKARNPVDCFGEPIHVRTRAQAPLTDVLVRGAQRPALLAVRTALGRHAIADALVWLVATGQAVRDAEGFYSLTSHADDVR